MISSHLLSEIEGILSDILLIDQGKLVISSPIDEMRQQAYRVDGSPECLDSYTSGKKVITQKTSGLSGFSYAIIYEPLTDRVVSETKARGISVSAVRVEDLCIYLTRENKEDELECLW